MAFKTPNRIGVMVYMLPETFRAIEDFRNPYVKTSTQCAMILDEFVASLKEEGV